MSIGKAEGFKFDLGRIVATPGALALSEREHALLPIILRHASGDWGEVCFGDEQLNDSAIASGERILSVYTLGGERVYVLTEDNRSVTTVLLAEEY